MHQQADPEITRHPPPSPPTTRESLLLESGWAAIWLAAHPPHPAAPPPALLLLRWQLFKASILDATAKLQLACGGAGGFADCFARVAATSAAPGGSAWLYAARMPSAAQAGALALVLAAQLPGAFLALSPFRGARLAGAALQLGAACLGAATGAGGAAPALVVAGLCVALADDGALSALCARALLQLKGGGKPGAAKADGGKAGGVQLTPINTGKGPVRRDSLDELLASPRYHGAVLACSL